MNVLGLGLVASTYSEEIKRSEALGRVFIIYYLNLIISYLFILTNDVTQALGGGAVGVLLGYPIAGFLYQLTGKTVPFLLIAFLAVVLLGNVIFE